MIASSDGDLAEVVFRHPRFVHVAAHDKGNLAVGSHHAEWHFVVAGVRRLAAAAAVLTSTRSQSPAVIVAAACPSSETELAPPLPPASETPGVIPRIAATSS